MDRLISADKVELIIQNHADGFKDSNGYFDGEQVANAIEMCIGIIDEQPTIQAIPIPNNATNGDMLTALFGEKALITLDTHNYLKDWWNAQYKRGN